jgi:hypothetical protein
MTVRVFKVICKYYANFIFQIFQILVQSSFDQSCIVMNISLCVENKNQVADISVLLTCV